MKGWLRLAALPLLLSACPSRELPQPVGGSLLILSPTQDASLNRSHDQNPAVDGLQIGVAVLALNALPDSRVRLQVGDAVAYAGLNAAQVASFAGVNVPFGEVTLTATLEPEQPGAEASVSFEAADEGAACAFVAPRDGDVFGPIDDVSEGDGFQTVLAVECVGLAEDSVVELRLGERAPRALDFDASGRALLANYELAEGRNTLALTSAALAEPVVIDVVVDTGRCLAALVPEDGTVIAYDSARDGAGTLAPVRTLELETSCAVGSSATLELAGTQFDPGAPSCSVTTFTTASANVEERDGRRVARFVDVPLPQSTRVVRGEERRVEDLVVRGAVRESDARAGRPLPNSYLVDTVPPQVTALETQVAWRDVVVGAMVLKGFEVTVTANLIGAGGPQTLSATDAAGELFLLEATPSLAVAEPPTCQDATTLPSSAVWVFNTFAPGELALFVSARDEAGNIATQAGSVVLVPELDGPELRITAPSDASAAEPVFLTLADDVDPATPGLQVDFRLELGNALVSQLVGDGVLNIPGQPPEFFSFDASPKLVRVTLQDGPGAAQRIDGISASASLTDGSTLQSAAVALRVDATPPVVTLLAPRDADVFAAGTSAIDVDVLVRGELNERQVRVSANGGAPLVQTVPAAASQAEEIVVVFSGVGVVPGPNQLVVEADDHIGKTNTTTVTGAVFIATGAASVALTAVQGLTPLPTTLGLPDADASLDNGYDATVQGLITAVPGEALIETFVTDASVLELSAALPVRAETALVPSSGALTYGTTVSLWSGAPLKLWLCATENARAFGFAMRACAVHELSVDASGPGSVSRFARLSGPAFSATTSVEFSITTADPGGMTQVCSLSADGIPTGVSRSFSTPSATFIPLTLAVGTHVVVAECVLGADTFYSQALTVQVQTAPSALNFIDAVGVQLAGPGPYFFNALATDSSSAAGYQHDVLVGAEQPDGTVVTLSVDGGPALTAIVLAGVARFRDVTLDAVDAQPTGTTVGLAASATDVFGGGPISVARTALVDRVAPELRFADGRCPEVIPLSNPFDDPGTFDRVEWRIGYEGVGAVSGALVSTELVQPSGTSALSVSLNGALTAEQPIALLTPTPARAFAASFSGRTADAAQNIGATPVCNVSVDPVVPSLRLSAQGKSFEDPGLGGTPPLVTFNNNDDRDAIRPGIQAQIFVTLQNMAAGSTVRLCSAATELSLSGRPSCSSVPGVVIATATSTAQGATGSQVIFSAVDLIDGDYGIAAEAELGPRRAVSPAQPPLLPSRTFPIRVDSLRPPTLDVLTTTNNIPWNDTAEEIRLGAAVWTGAARVAEGTRIGNTLQTGPFLLIFNGPVEAHTVSLTSSLQPLGGEFEANGSQGLYFNANPLIEGEHLITVRVETANGNFRTTTRRFLVDLTPPSALIEAAQQQPYRCASGVCALPGGRSVPASVFVGDNMPLDGGCLCLRTASSPRCLNAPSECPGEPLSGDPLSGSTQEIASTVALAEGRNDVTAMVRDAAGNEADAAVVVYDVDTLATTAPPVLTVAGTSGDCSLGAPCTVAFDPTCYDTLASAGVGAIPDCPRWYSSDTYRVTTQGTEAGPTTACRLPGDACSSRVRLLGTPIEADGTPLNAELEVVGSLREPLFSDATAQDIEDFAGPATIPGLDRAPLWSVVLETADAYGNRARSAPAVIALAGFDGAIVTLRKGYDHPVDDPPVVPGAGPQRGAALTSNQQLGVRHNKTHPGSFTTDLLVDIAWNQAPPAPSPRCVELMIDGGPPLEALSLAVMAEVESVAFEDVALAGGPHTFIARVFAGAGCSAQGNTDIRGLAQASNVDVTTALPSVAFDFAWRQLLRFNSEPVDPGAATNVVTAVRNAPVGGTTVPDLFAAAGYQFADPTSSPGAPVAAPVRVRVQAAASGQVSLATQLADGLLGNTTTAVPASADVTFNFDGSLAVPSSVSGARPAVTATHVLTATACNRAGDCCDTAGSCTGGAPDASLRLRVNVAPPASVNDAVVCLGSDTALSGGDASYAEAAACAAICAAPGEPGCDRRKGEAALRFTAPAARAGTGGGVSGYDVAVAIADRVAPGPVQCGEIFTSFGADLARLFVPVAAHSIAAPGDTQVLYVSGLPVEQRLCVAVFSRDDVGNRSQAIATLRTSPLLPVGPASALVAVDRLGDDSDRGLSDPQAFDTFGTFGDTFPLTAVRIGDMDGDGGAEFAVGGILEGEDGVRVYSSKRTRNAAFAPAAERYKPREILRPSGPGQFFGYSLAGGDLNGDGFADLVVAGNGVVYVYFGSGDGVSADPRLVRTAGCGSFTTDVPTPACPHVVIRGGPGSQLGSFVTSGHASVQLAADDPRRASFTLPVDLLIGDTAIDAGRGGFVLIRHGGTMFPAAPGATTTVYDLSSLAGGDAAQVTRFASFNQELSGRLGYSAAFVDLDGDGRQDLAIPGDRTAAPNATTAPVVHLFRGRASWPATLTRDDADACDVVTSSAGALVPNVANVGRLQGGAAEWLLARSTGLTTRVYEGGASFFPAVPDPICVAGRSQEVRAAPTGPGGVTLGMTPVTRFGALLDPSCNVPAAAASLRQANDAFGLPTGAASAGDFDGDGTDELLIGQTGTSGAPARAQVVKLASSGCGAPARQYRTIAQLTGNATTDFGLGTFVFNAGTHVGGEHPALGAAGIAEVGGNFVGAVWIYR